MKQLIGLVVLLSLACPVGANAQEMKWETRGYYKPKAILVELRSQQKRIEYLENSNRSNEVEQLVKDIDDANRAMVNDFKDHFKFCPVYFIVDTNVNRVVAKQYDGILLDINMQPVRADVMNKAGDDFFIVYFGMPMREKAGMHTEQEVPRSQNGQGLVVIDHNGKQLLSPFQFYYYNNRRYYGVSRGNPQYNFASKKYNIEYYALAADLSGGLHEFYAR
ncbi:MAG: hypothetical protein JSS82_19070 [Bacteroidetes bacterium]|nr:hypothetical protein [Bacteroidota bacterium]